MRLIIMATAAAIAFPSAALAAPGNTSTSTANATAEVIAPLNIACGPMHWGQLAPKHVATTITMNAQGTPLTDNDDISVPGSRNNAQPSHCDVTGEVGMTFNVTLPTSSTLTYAGHNMTMTTFTVSSDLDATPGDPLNRTLENVGGIGSNGFGVGATLNVGADQAPGLYQGTFDVMVQYN